jgi:hypothetical protein
MPDSTSGGALLFLWLLPLAWTVHDIEEIYTIERWVDANREQLNDLADRSVVGGFVLQSLPETTRQFTIAVLTVGVLFVGVTLAASFGPLPEGILLYTVLLGGFFLHGVIHIGQTVLFRKYTPGLVSAMFVVLPVSGFLYERLLATGLIDSSFLLGTALVGVVLFVPIVVGANHFATRVNETLSEFV